MRVLLLYFSQEEAGRAAQEITRILGAPASSTVGNPRAYPSDSWIEEYDLIVFFHDQTTAADTRLAGMDILCWRCNRPIIVVISKARPFATYGQGGPYKLQPETNPPWRFVCHPDKLAETLEQFQAWEKQPGTKKQEGA